MHVQRLRICVDRRGGFADTGEGREVEGEAVDVGSGYFLLDGVFRELKSAFHSVFESVNLMDVSKHANEPLGIVASDDHKLRVFCDGTRSIEADPIEGRAGYQN
jgi:hypothetical protein